VDAHGVLLPLAAADSKLPVLRGTVPPPTGRTGQVWGDAGVETAAAVAALLAPHQEQLGLNRAEIAGGVLAWSSQRTRVIWGPVASDKPAAAKLQALLAVWKADGSLDGREIDVRDPDETIVRPQKRP
jgi:hypothetical protein